MLLHMIFSVGHAAAAKIRTAAFSAVENRVAGSGSDAMPRAGNKLAATFPPDCPT